MGSGRRLKRSKSSAVSRRADLEDGRSERPTDEEYSRMVLYKSFVVTSDDGTEFRFEKEQVVLVLPHGFDPRKEHELSSYWAARIKDIRAHEYTDGSNSVWVRVQWFYSGKDVSDVIKSFDRHAVGQFERIYSDHHDYIQPEAFEMVIPMYKLNEVDFEQMYIPNNRFYRRYTFEYLARNLQPKPGLMTCLCQKPYNPNDTDPESLMHFCPRPSCRMGFHHRCLMGAKSKESASALAVPLTVKIPRAEDIQRNSREGDTIKVTRSARKHAVPQKRPLTRKTKVIKEVEDEAEVTMSIIPPSATAPATTTRSQQVSSSLSPRSLRLLSCSPDVDETLDLQSLVYSRNLMDVDSDTHVSDSEEEIVVPQKKRRGRPPKKQTKVKAAKRANTENPTLESILESLPPNLLTIAIQPLVRGAAFPAGGVAGNIGMVTRARRLVHTALQMGGGQNAVSEWEETVFGEDREVVGVEVKNAVVIVKFGEGRPEKKDKGLPPFVCPNCKSAI